MKGLVADGGLHMDDERTVVVVTYGVLFIHRKGRLTSIICGQIAVRCVGAAGSCRTGISSSALVR
jgi:hypothetical protein